MQEKIAQLITSLKECRYVVDYEFATTLALMDSLERPLLIEGEAGIGKTAIAAALSCARGTKLIGLQCFEGIDAAG